MTRLLNLSESVIRTNSFDIEMISARLSLNENIVRSLMSILCDQGIWRYNAKNDDMIGIKSKIVNTCNQLIPLLESRIVSIAPLYEGASIQDVLTFVSYIRDQLKQNTQPANNQIEYDEDEFKSYGDRLAKHDIRQSEFVIDYDIDGIALKGDTLIFKNDGSWERKPRYTKEELIHTKHELESMLRVMYEHLFCGVNCAGEMTFYITSKIPSS